MDKAKRWPAKRILLQIVVSMAELALVLGLLYGCVYVDSVYHEYLMHGHFAPDSQVEKDSK